MKSFDVVQHLAKNLPRFCDDFTSNSDIVSLSLSTNTVTATTALDHGLTVGAQVNIQGAQTPITVSTINRVATIATVTTATDHDLTEVTGSKVELNGANEAEFNGTFDLLTVPNRRTFTMSVQDSGATTFTGTPILLNGFSIFQSYNGLYNVETTPTNTTFTYTLPHSGLVSPVSSSGIVAKQSPRISSAVDFEGLVAAYTAQPQDDAWLFAVLGDGAVSRSRANLNDSTDIIHNVQDFNQKIVQGLSLFVFMPSSAEISGNSARDKCEGLLSPILKSILGYQFPSYLGETSFPVVMVNHGMEFYNSAFYVHRYEFEATQTVTEQELFDPSDSVAFRDIVITSAMGTGSENRQVNIDLDRVLL